jgi:sodium/bile acid cotransporter 7
VNSSPFPVLLKRWFSQSWFLVALLAVLVIGSWQSENLSWLTKLSTLRNSVVVSVIFIMALGVPLADILKQVAKPIPTLLASAINMIFLPIAAWSVGPLLPSELAGGLIVASAIPCTLASAAVWTRRAGGDDTIAMLVMLITNVTCFVVTPLWLALLLGRVVQLNTFKLISELFLLVLLPSVFAQILRLRSASVAQLANRYKLTLSTVAQAGILFMVLLGAIQLNLSSVDTTATAPASENVAPSVWQRVNIIPTALIACALHGVALALGWYTAVGLGLSRRETIGVAISGSQKTLMVGLQLCLDCGVSILPMVMYHIGQLLMDTFLADWWLRHSQKSQVSAESEQS